MADSSDSSRFGTRWWRESLARARLLRGGVAATVGFVGSTLTLPGCAEFFSELQSNSDDEPVQADDGQVDVSVDALKLQREQGWDVGDANGALAFPDSSALDFAGGDSWRAAMEPLAATLTPTQPQLASYYVPTLFQSLIGPAGQRLRAVMRPIHTPEMDQDFARGQALRAQFGLVDWPRDTAIVVDAPGPRAVALAAALADHFAPVFTFGNWPHPLGVVPAHQTLAATLFYLPTLTAAQAVRPADAPPVFVLDSNRLLPYRDADRQFDNRYFVHLPTAAELATIGVKHLLYVSADGSRELDDLNGAFVALCNAGVDVKMVALADFVRVDENAPPPAELAAGDTPESGDESGDAAGEPDPEDPVPVAGAFGFFWNPWPWLWPAPFWTTHYWYRGCWWHPGAFWADYGTYVPPPGRRLGRFPVHPIHAVPLRAPTPVAARWVPAPRPTLFGPGRVVAAPPAGFGRVPGRASRESGHVTGIRPGGSWNRGGWEARSNGGWHGAGGGWHGGSGWQGGGGGHFVGAPHGGRSGSIGRAGGGGG